MTREEELAFKRRWQLVNDFIAGEIRATSPEVRFQQLRTMFATAHRLHDADPAAEAAVADVRARWLRLKEFHAAG